MAFIRAGRCKTGRARRVYGLLALLDVADDSVPVHGEGRAQHFYEQAGSTDKMLKLYEGHYHDLLNDIDKEIVLADIKGWLDAHITSPHAEPAPQTRAVVRP